MPDEPWMIVTVLVLAALIGATISGMLGMAGGMLLLGVMSNVGLSLNVIIPVHGVVQLFSNGTRVVAYLKSVRWRPFLIVLFVAAPMPVIGMWLRDQVSESATLLAIGLIVLYATWGPKGRVAHMPEWMAFAIVGVLIGTLGAVFGATGPLVAPFVLRAGWKKEEMIATSAVCQAYSHIIKIIAFGVSGFSFGDHLDLMIPMIVAVIVGTWIGRWALGRLSEAWFLILYRGLITLLGLRLVLVFFVA